MKVSIFLTKQCFCILLIILVLFAQFFLPYKSNASDNIHDGVISIHLIGEHDSDKYWFGQCLIPLKINAYMESGNDIGSIPVEKSWISGYNSEKLGKQTVTITYGGKTTTFTVTVVDYLKNIDIVGLKQNYNVGETLDLSGASITEITASGVRVTGKAITADMISGFSTSTPGVKKLTIDYHKNELGEDIKLNTFITVSDSIFEPSYTQPESTPNIDTLKDDLIKSLLLEQTKQPVNSYNEDIIDSNEDFKIRLNDIFKNISKISEIKLYEIATDSSKLFILMITRLFVLFI